MSIVINEGLILLFIVQEFDIAGAFSHVNNVVNPLEILKPYPKAGPRKSTRTSVGRKRSTAILTDTPVKDKLEQENVAASANELANVKRRLVQQKQQQKSAKKRSRKSPPNKEKNRIMKMSHALCAKNCGKTVGLGKNGCSVSNANNGLM